MTDFKLIKPNTEEWLFLLVHLICLSTGKIFISYILIFLLFLFSLISILKKNYSSFFLMLILGSYHSDFHNIYTTEVYGLNLIYPLVLFYFLLSTPAIRLNRIQLFLLVPFFSMYLINIISGYFFKFSFQWYINEIMLFTLFLFFIVTTINFPKRNIFKILNILCHYVLYFYPILTFISIITSSEENLFFDEFDKFYFIAIIPILFLKIPFKFIIIILNIIVFILKAKYTYTSSLNILLVLSSVTTLFIFSKIHLYKKLLLIIIVFLGAFIVYQYSSKLTKFKIYQAGVAITEVLEGNVSAIPKSPRVRVVEFMISFENLKDQGFFFYLVGKGYGSYIDDNKTDYFNKYKIQLKPEDYSELEIEHKKFKKGHGGIPYIPIKMGIIGLILFLLLSAISFTLINIKNLAWLGISSSFYIITTFSYGLKNFIFVGIITGLILAIKYGNKRDQREFIHS